MRFRGAAVLLLAGVLAAGRVAHSQDPPPPSPVPSPSPDVPAGSVRLGRIVLTPSLRIDTIGLDTNVRDSRSDRRTDLLAIGGPELEARLPLVPQTTLAARAHVGYVYYARTPEQRRVVGSGEGRFEWRTGRTRLELHGSEEHAYQRIDPELDRRIEERDRALGALLRRRILGRVGVRAEAERHVRALPDEQDAELAPAFDREERLVRGGLEYALTYKTRLVVEADREEARFDVDPLRSGRLERLRGGVETDPAALVSGHVLGGTGRVRLDAAGSPREAYTFVDVDVTLNWSPRTRIGGGVLQDRQWSVLAGSSSPTVLRREWTAHLFKELFPRVELRLRGRRTQTRHAAGEDAQRDELSSQLAYRVRPRLLVGGRVTHVVRRRGAQQDDPFEGTIAGLAITWHPR